MISYFNRHIIAFVEEWGNKVVPQLNTIKYKDATKIFAQTKKSRMILDSVKEGKRIYILGFKGCRGMIKKWLTDERGRMIRVQGRGVVEINNASVSLCSVDINQPFVCSDEILPLHYKKDKPYNLEKDIVKEAMRKYGFDPQKDLIFIFFLKPSEAKFGINRFLDEVRHVMTEAYLRAKGILIIKDPKWKKYHASDELTKYTNAFFFDGVTLFYTNREVIKEETLGI